MQYNAIQATQPADLIAQLSAVAHADYPSTHDARLILGAFVNRYGADPSAARDLGKFLTELASAKPDRAAVLGRIGAEVAKNHVVNNSPFSPSPMQRACIDGLLAGLERHALDSENIEACLDDLGHSLFLAAGMPDVKRRMAELGPRIAAPMALLDADVYGEMMEIFRQRLDTLLMSEEEQQQVVLKSLAAENTDLRRIFEAARVQQETVQAELIGKILYSGTDPRP